MSLKQIQVELLSSWGGDRQISEAAWVSSTDKAKLENKTEEDVKRVVTSIVQLSHGTPKERVWFEYYIRLPIFAERQLDKQRMSVQFQDFQIECLLGEFGRGNITQNELSGRYRTIPDRPYGLPNDIGTILEKAYSVIELPPRESNNFAPGKELLTTIWLEDLQKQHDAYQRQLDILKSAEKKGVISNGDYKRAREVLRGRLGTAFMTDMRIVLNLRSLENLCNDRLAPAAQPEIRWVACQMVREAQKQEVAPICINQMIETNNWLPRILEIEELVSKDN